MLPIFRLIPVGGVFLAIAILLLALNPPQAMSRSTRARLLPARGALIDRTEHPEWRQFLIQAALRRAGEVERLRDLRDTAIRSEPPVARIPEPEPVEAKPEVVEALATETEPDIAKASPAEAKADVAEAPSAESMPEVATAAPIEVEPNVAEAAPVNIQPETPGPKVAAAAPVEAQPDAAELKPAAAEPEPAANELAPAAAEPEIAAAAPVEAAQKTEEPKIAEAVPIEPKPEVPAPEPIATEPEPVASEPRPVAAEPKIAVAAPITETPADITPTPIAVKPESVVPMQMASVAPAPAPNSKPAVAAAPSQDNVAVPASPLETNGSRFRADVVPPETKIAALPKQPAEDNSDDITGSIQPADRTATIPVGIGEASSAEIAVTLPRERPPVLRQIDLRRARDSKVQQPQRRVHHASGARKRTPGGIPPEFDLFALLFKAFDPDGNFEPSKPTIPYQPNDNW